MSNKVSSTRFTTAPHFNLIMGAGADHIYFKSQPLFSELWIPLDHSYFSEKSRVARRQINSELDDLVREANVAVGDTRQLLRVDPDMRYASGYLPTQGVLNPVVEFRDKFKEKYTTGEFIPQFKLELYTRIILKSPPHARSEIVNRFFFQPVSGTINGEKIEACALTEWFHPDFMEEDQKIEEKYWFILDKIMGDKKIDYLFLQLLLDRSFTGKVDGRYLRDNADRIEFGKHTEFDRIHPQFDGEHPWLKFVYATSNKNGVSEQVHFWIEKLQSKEDFKKHYKVDPPSELSFPSCDWNRVYDVCGPLILVQFSFDKTPSLKLIKELVTQYQIPYDPRPIEEKASQI